MTIKKLVIVLALSCAFTMMFAGVAFAAAGTGSNYTGASNALDPYAENVVGTTPHMGYTTTTVKCAVCHAVHRAPAAGQLLMRGTVAGACEYCHISANVAVSKVYGANVANYNSDTDKNHYSGSGSRCVDCHAVHGAGTVTSTAGGTNPVSAKILKVNGSVQTGLPAAWSFTTGTDRSGVVSAFCTQCHAYWTDQYDTATTGSLGYHIMGAATSTYGGAPTSLTNATVAWAPSTYCRSCHDAGNTDVYGADTAAGNFPHYTPSASRFMFSAANYTSYDASVTAGTAAGAADPSEDGACLKCHRSNSIDTGIGLNF